jgi:EAL domain-containing protein (putative c-di-GMP-specific phosphodiesterase class I)/DNA-binding response OmpR family regulator
VSQGGETDAARTAPILVVDDEPSLRVLYRRALERAGFQTVEAGSGDDALSVVDATPVSLVLLDVHMPGLSGLEVVRSLRRQPETATLPILLVTGSGGDEMVVAGLEAGADDFLPKPVRMDELVARVRAQVRSSDAWAARLQAELTARAGVVASLGRLTLQGSPEEVGQMVVSELARHTRADYIALYRVVGHAGVQPLAVYRPETDVQTSLPPLSRQLARHLLEHAEGGPWTDDDGRDLDESNTEPAARSVAVTTGSPIHSRERLVGLLVMGLGEGAAERVTSRGVVSGLSRLQSAVIDYAGILSSMAAERIAGDPQAMAARSSLEGILESGAFRTVYQPIVELPDGAIVGYEALTRFDDGVRPDIRFQEATTAGLGNEFQAAAIARALETAARMPAELMLTLNASPGFVLQGKNIRQLIGGSERPIVLELTEHSRIDDYDVLRTALGDIDGNVKVAVDDAGAGYASLRHILELKPAFAKLDISLVHGIEGDTVRQALVAGLRYFAARSGCVLIAEGVETTAEAAVLQRLGIGLAQGYLFGRPAPLPDSLPKQPDAATSLN